MSVLEPEPPGRGRVPWERTPRRARRRAGPRSRRRPRAAGVALATGAAALAMALALLLALRASPGRPAPAMVELPVWDVRVPVPASDPEAAARVLAAAAAELARRPITLRWEAMGWQQGLDQLGVALDTAALVDSGRAVARLGSALAELPPVTVQARLDEQALAAGLAPVRAAVEREPVPARLEAAGDGVQITPDRPGRRLSLPAAAAALRGVLDRPAGARWQPGEPLPPLVIDLPVQEAPAVPTADELAALGIRRRIASFTTEYDATVPRAENVERAARTLDGLVLMPGALLSYNALMGPVDADHGWQPANVIVGNRLVQGVGGGVCQAATTLYGAALRAGLEVIERHPHNLAVSYIEPSQDAAVAPGVQDLKLRNTGPGAVYFRTEAGGGRVTIHVYGDLPPGREIAVESAVIERLPVEVRTVADPELPPGVRQVARQGQAGVRSRGWRVYRQDGAEVARELLSEDRYPGSPRVVRAGPDA